MLEPASEWPHIIQFIAIDRIEQLLGYRLLPVVVLADRQWPLPGPSCDGPIPVDQGRFLPEKV